MMRAMSWVAVCCVAACCVAWGVGCSSKDKEPPAPPITYQTVPSPETTAPDHAPTPGEVPVVEDFDDESEAQINADNFRAELDRLEAEITTDPAQ